MPDNTDPDPANHAGDHDCPGCRQWRRETLVEPVKRRIAWLEQRLEAERATLAQLQLPQSEERR
jgi:hypothetical protein